MAQPPDDPWLNGFVSSVVLASVGAWIYVITQWRRHGDVLPYEPRRPVPWGPPAALLAVLFVLLAALASLAQTERAREAAGQPDATEIAVQIIVALTPQVVFVCAFFFAIAAIYRPNWADLGLPRTVAEALRDVAIGVVACLAALLPVHAVQLALLYLTGSQDDPSRHPLVEMVTGAREPSVVVMGLATLAAVIVAPLCEEVTFRLLFQGWLEKWEDERLRWRAASELSVSELYAGQGLNEVLNDDARMSNEGAKQGDAMHELPNSSFDIRHSSLALPMPPRGLALLPYGWLPILTSSMLFGLAHFGYGPEPVALFMLAIFLGYVYQRTHRILPCIVAHALFNLFTIVILWRMVFHAAE